MSEQPVNRNSRPVVSLSTFMDEFSLSSDGAMQRIDTGEVKPAFNVSAPNAQRREVRILRQSFEAYRDGRECEVNTVADAVAIILGKATNVKGMAVIRRSSLQRRMGLSAEHIKNLQKAGQIRPAPITVGKSESPWLMHDSVSQWLTRCALGKIAYLANRNTLSRP
jgi:hypothetical protein